MSQPAYPGSQPVAAIASRLAQATRNSAHQFVPGDYSLLENNQINWQQVLGHRQITDTYLLGLAVRHHCRFVTFDTRIEATIVPGAQSKHLVSL